MQCSVTLCFWKRYTYPVQNASHHAITAIPIHCQKRDSETHTGPCLVGIQLKSRQEGENKETSFPWCTYSSYLMWYETSSREPVLDVDDSLLSVFKPFSGVLLLSVEGAALASDSSLPLVRLLGLPTLAGGGAVSALPFCPLMAGVTFSMTPSNQAPILTSLQSTSSFTWTQRKEETMINYDVINCHVKLIWFNCLFAQATPSAGLTCLHLIYFLSVELNKYS